MKPVFVLKAISKNDTSFILKTISKNSKSAKMVDLQQIKPFYGSVLSLKMVL